jgi:20S proteasome alpha/beta subunit
LTIAISLKINDGLVLAADSATTLLAPTPTGMAAMNVYNNANKIVNLYKGLPIGVITWGAGSIGNASISTLLKDLRAELTAGSGPEEFNREGYTIEQVANRLRNFIYEQRYIPAFAAQPHKPSLGFVVGGYSSGSASAEEYQIDIKLDGSCGPPRLLREAGASGASWAGEPEPLNRLFTGFSGVLPQVLQQQLKLTPDQTQALFSALRPFLQAQLISPAMPLQDAIDLAVFMVELTISWSRFAPGAPSVGGPIEVAAISKHEGFRWIRRKYYFQGSLNPETGGQK